MFTLVRLCWFTCDRKVGNTNLHQPISGLSLLKLEFKMSFVGRSTVLAEEFQFHANFGDL